MCPCFTIMQFCRVAHKSERVSGACAQGSGRRSREKRRGRGYFCMAPGSWPVSRVRGRSDTLSGVVVVMVLVLVAVVVAIPCAGGVQLRWMSSARIFRDLATESVCLSVCLACFRRWRWACLPCRHHQTLLLRGHHPAYASAVK